ncbi:putative Hydroxyacylglutathione hydrolase [Daphnia magna]|uniref:Putative Hydroxyacylglutathione hydrolase n=1 Tax=Daphnia magna TaxID=35525 RepID=A0A164VLZ9_9CRUS|nr:putative Hydroxyacylglutathione hydrolase [Daphnia magna]
MKVYHTSLARQLHFSDEGLNEAAVVHRVNPTKVMEMAPTPPPRQGGGGSCSTFGFHVEPDNESVAKPISWTKEQRAKSEPIVPSLLSEEKLFNPFMRDNELTVQKHAKQNDPIKTMKSSRTEKNSFKANI